MSTAAQSSPVAIITGAASGVGAATAKMLAAKGYKVLVNYNRSADLAQQVVQDCLNLGVQAMAVQGDVSDDAVCINLANQAMTQWSLQVVVTGHDREHLAYDACLACHRY